MAPHDSRGLPCSLKAAPEVHEEADGWALSQDVGGRSGAGVGIDEEEKMVFTVAVGIILLFGFVFLTPK